ncbi:hypothetical protein GAW62_16595 [Salmonella enterica subsp. enterica]|nr:hypothetical protein [Salmonella enterica subsp. enterica serovar Kottbus]EDC6416124.1 hypothetical protein [Salmonella enterica subsp. enterica serovar Kottbus]EDC6448154.1 hypothetical protein [Salmonella enterica subsp. enterica serovar Kottbus]
MASDQSTRKNRVHKGVHNQKSHYEETSYNAALKPILYKQIQILALNMSQSPPYAGSRVYR